MQKIPLALSKTPYQNVVSNYCDMTQKQICFVKIAAMVVQM